MALRRGRQFAVMTAVQVPRRDATGQTYAVFVRYVSHSTRFTPCVSASPITASTALVMEASSYPAITTIASPSRPFSVVLISGRTLNGAYRIDRGNCRPPGAGNSRHRTSGGTSSHDVTRIVARGRVPRHSCHRRVTDQRHRWGVGRGSRCTGNAICPAMGNDAASTTVAAAACTIQRLERDVDIVVLVPMGVALEPSPPWKVSEFTVPK